MKRFEIAFALIAGALIGVGGYTFIYAKGYSYLTNDPQACTNCHVMRGQYDSWIKSSHRTAATCNDCHTPYNLAGKYRVKASNGFFHSVYFTTGWFPDNIRITQSNHRVAEGACRRCHQNITQAMDGNAAHGDAEGLQCTRCHGSVGHSEAAVSSGYPIVSWSTHGKQ